MSGNRVIDFGSIQDRGNAIAHAELKVLAAANEWLSRPPQRWDPVEWKRRRDALDAAVAAWREVTS